MHKLLLSLLVVTASAVAQSYTVSPSVVGTADGNSNNTYPWSWASGRYQQIHGDMRGTVRTITALSQRRDGGLGASTTAVARSVDVEYYMADSDFALASSTFATNYASAPMNVVTRKFINLPDWTAATTKPAPFTFTVPFDVPFVYVGLKDLVWEVAVHSTTATGTWPADAFSAILSSSGASVSTGLGCFATTRTSRMSISASQQTEFVPQTMSLSYFANSAPASAPSAFLLGLVNPGIPVPGLCANLYVDQVFMTINATAGTTGLFSAPTITVPYDPQLVGFRVYAQAASLDAGQTSGLPVAVSNGLQTTFAAMPVTPGTGEKVARVFQIGSPASAAGTLGLYYGVVTQFTH